MANSILEFYKQNKKLRHNPHLVYLIRCHKSNKDDRNDAEAIVEAASLPSMRYVSAKTIEQQDLQSLLRSREGGIEMRTKMHNQLRGLLAEYGIAISQEISHLHKTLPKLFDRGKENELTVALKEMLEMQYNLVLSQKQRR